MSEISLDSNDLTWQLASEYPKGTQIKVLRRKGNLRTVLLRIPPHFWMDSHSHTICEQHFVLEGAYESGGKTFGPGAFRYIPAHTDHGPFSSETGAVLLIVWEG
jgi:anti-sigma factor ChrR (cupin superfamily)